MFYVLTYLLIPIRDLTFPMRSLFNFLLIAFLLLRS